MCLGRLGFFVLVGFFICFGFWVCLVCSFVSFCIVLFGVKKKKIILLSSSTLFQLFCASAFMVNGKSCVFILLSLQLLKIPISSLLPLCSVLEEFRENHAFPKHPVTQMNEKDEGSSQFVQNWSLTSCF